ncbi:hypothetical protein K7X08_012105 [Anisodus acutangulus]|uniref:Uncharacterized protein n=1 Tax=Anisodus acutangulus TaxID=402998 RepID=A0A9Q1LAR2_9SOLA|nr:hypothetical protein K7X08_012105 [Anisodus acutangulus]
MSSNRPYNFSPYENWSNGQGHDPNSHGPEHNNWNRWQPIFPRPPPPREIPQNPRRIVHDLWLTVTERPFQVAPGATSYPYPYAGQPRRRPPHPPVLVLVHNDDIPRHAPYPRPNQLPFDSPPPWFLQNQETSRDNSKLSPNEQKATLNKLKKEIYNPVQTKVAKKVGLYFRGLNNNMNYTTNEPEKDKDEDDLMKIQKLTTHRGKATYTNPFLLLPPFLSVTHESFLFQLFRLLFFVSVSVWLLHQYA